MLTLSAPALRLAFACKVCYQPLDQEQAKDDAQQIVLFGAVAYAVCPACKRVVEGHRDRSYRRRYRRFVGRK